MASGDPFPKSVILWTRVTVAAKNKPAFLDYCVSKTRKFSKCVVRGTTLTTKDVDFTAKVRHCTLLMLISSTLTLLPSKAGHDTDSGIETRCYTLPQVEARKLKPNTKFFYQWRYRQNDKTAPVRPTWMS